MLFSDRQRRLAALLFLLLFAVIYGVPYGLILAASLARSWDSALPSGVTLAHFAALGGGENVSALVASLVTAVAASLLSLLLGLLAALGVRRLSRRAQSACDLIFYAPSAVPTVSVGLGLLVAFSRPPLLLNGTIGIVLMAHLLIISAYAYGGVRAGLARLPEGIEAMAESLGAGPLTCFRRVTLPMLAPHLGGAAALALAMSMGELAATAMVYPPGWATLPLRIFALSDRGAVLDAAALTVVLAGATFGVIATLRR